MRNWSNHPSTTVKLLSCWHFGVTFLVMSNPSQLVSSVWYFLSPFENNPHVFIVTRARDTLCFLIKTLLQFSDILKLKRGAYEAPSFKWFEFKVKGFKIWNSNLKNKYWITQSQERRKSSSFMQNSVPVNELKYFSWLGLTHSFRCASGQKFATNI